MVLVGGDTRPRDNLLRVLQTASITDSKGEAGVPPPPAFPTQGAPRGAPTFPFSTLGPAGPSAPGPGPRVSGSPRAPAKLRGNPPPDTRRAPGPILGVGA